MLVGYCRVSTASGEQLSLLNSQRSRLTRNGCNFILQDIDSGLNCERVNYQQLKALVRSRSVSAILVTSSSRLGRDARECDDFISLCDRFDVSCNALDEGRLSMITAEDMLITRLRGSINQTESMKISQRVKAGYQEGKRQNRPMRRACWGYKLSEDKKLLIPHPYEFNQAKKFIETLKRVHWRPLQALGFWNSNIPLNSDRVVHYWLCNPVLRGGLGYGFHHMSAGSSEYEYIVWGTHTPLLSVADFDMYKKSTAANRKSWGKNSIRKPSVLTSLCICGYCGRKMSYRTGRKIIYCYRFNCGHGFHSVDENLVLSFIQSNILQTIQVWNERWQPSHPYSQISQLKEDIKRLISSNDPDMSSAIQIKRQRLQLLLQVKPSRDDHLLEQLKDSSLYAEEKHYLLRPLLLKLLRAVVIQDRQPIRLELND